MASPAPASVGVGGLDLAASPHVRAFFGLGRVGSRISNSPRIESTQGRMCRLTPVSRLEVFSALGTVRWLARRQIKAPDDQRRTKSNVQVSIGRCLTAIPPAGALASAITCSDRQGIVWMYRRVHERPPGQSPGGHSFLLR